MFVNHIFLQALFSYHVDFSGKKTVTKVASGDAVKRDLFDSKKAFIFDAGSDIFVWVSSISSCLCVWV